MPTAVKNRVRNPVQNPVALTGASPVRVVMVVRKLPPEGASSKKVTRERFDQHAWPRLSALKAHAETPKNVGKTTLVGLRFGVQISDPKNGGRESISSYEGPHFGGQILDPKMGSSRMMFFRAGALSKKRFLRASQTDSSACLAVPAILLFGHRPDGCGQARSCELERLCQRNQFLDRISNPILRSSTRASFAGRQQVASSFSQTRIAMMTETGEMVEVSSRYVLLWAQQALDRPGTQSPELRASIKCYCAAFLLVGMAATCSPPQLGVHPKTSNHMAQQRNHPKLTLNPPYTAWESERNPHGAHREPTGNPAGTCMAEREEPTRSLREPTGNPPGTHPKPYLKQRRTTSHPLV